jgi:hypothetical protein
MERLDLHGRLIGYDARFRPYGNVTDIQAWAWHDVPRRPNGR